MTVGKDVSVLFPDVIKCMQTNNIELRERPACLCLGSINGIDNIDGHAVGPGACLCRSAFARHGVAPQEGGLSFCGLFSNLISATGLGSAVPSRSKPHWTALHSQS